MALRIEDYALIGDRQTSALVGKDGSIDWLCLPRFDSGACFASLLGTPENGRWLLAPEGTIKRTQRKYRPGTLILETEFETADGVVAVIDFMPTRDRDPNVVRVVEGRQGNVQMAMELVIRFDYGSILPWVRKNDCGLSAIAGPDAVTVLTPVPLTSLNLRTTAHFTVKPGQRVPFSMSWHRSYDEPNHNLDSESALSDTESWWNDWSRRCTYQGPYRDHVLRSLITLKALTYEPTGGIVAAPTTSLPEHLGGVRNWDYRYCWIRDATLSLMALLHCGYLDDAAAWRRWLLRAVAGSPAETQIMYGLAGERRLSEWEAAWLPGYENSKPVRIGNAAHGQLQLDVYGELFDALFQSREAGLPMIEDGWHVGHQLIEWLEQHWSEPDNGIWEERGQRQQFVNSKVLAWVAFDRAIRLIEKHGHPGQADLKRMKQTREAIHAEVCEKGFDRKRNTFTQYYGSQALDASTLVIPLTGFLPASDPRVLGTLDAIRKELMRNGFVQRYNTSESKDGLPSGEGAFLPCTFWFADNLTLMGRREEATEIFERMIGLCNDVGLLSEEYDPRKRRLLGNFPQGFSHIGLITTALNLARDEQGPSHCRASRH